ncbi:ATP-dependent RNA helicase RhlE [Tepidimonas sediminis]|uniref:DEAD-box ATP-dependent RNA helicase RhpA n=1 Tax=Tepidimonas sediminis TaxID=2588941 RepID=A0A554WS61_9BURK|nr:DEAD/DEAH box helicase [Tepidimonas sediminis]TSE26404.1 ATP-dependent RNA helicase RhlE [Tepidimonas sediminis]
MSSESTATPPTFASLGLAEPLTRAVAEMGYTSMTPIQARAIPVVLQGRDVMGAAQTGTGKTAAFSLPLLQRLLRHANTSTSPARHPVRALVLLPTRELADQVAQQVRLYAKYTPLRSAVVFGGMDMKPQVEELRKGVEILVATPGRLLDHIEARSVVLNQVEYVVLDEADRMLDIGFLPDLQRILAYLPRQRTTLLFSATFSPEIKRLAASYLQDPVVIEVARPNTTASTVEQRFFRVEEEDKRAALKALLRAHAIQQAFVFVNSKLGCARLARALQRDGLAVAALHGDKSQDERLKALEAFKQGQVQLLVCTDVAARGLDIKDVPAVFNVDVPFNAEDYVHRIGRTGRAGATGLALTFVTGRDARQLAEIEKLIGRKAEVEPLELPDERRGRPARGHDGARGARGAVAAAPQEAAPGRAQAAAPARPPVPPSASPDPLGDRPYEPSLPPDVTPEWERNARSAAPKGLSAYIRPKRKVPALLRAPLPAAAPAAPADSAVTA